jgi:hypothetical protein
VTARRNQHRQWEDSKNAHGCCIMHSVNRGSEGRHHRDATQSRLEPLAHLQRLGIVAPLQATLAVIQDPVQIATEGAQWGSVHAHGFLNDAVLLSDDAGQFAVGRHALCWVHAERLVHKLDTFTDLHRLAQQQVRKLIWTYYAALKKYRTNPSNSRRLSLRARFDRIFRRRTGFVTLDRLLARLWANKAELLMVLERPEIPLHNPSYEFFMGQTP